MNECVERTHRTGQRIQELGREAVPMEQRDVLDEWRLVIDEMTGRRRHQHDQRGKRREEQPRGDPHRGALRHAYNLKSAASSYNGTQAVTSAA